MVDCLDYCKDLTKTEELLPRPCIQQTLQARTRAPKTVSPEQREREREMLPWSEMRTSQDASYDPLPFDISAVVMSILTWLDNWLDAGYQGPPTSARIPRNLRPPPLPPCRITHIVQKWVAARSTTTGQEENKKTEDTDHQNPEWRQVFRRWKV